MNLFIELRYIDRSCFIRLALHQTGFVRYKTFGLERAWLVKFFENIEHLDLDNFGLGSVKVESMKNWFEDAGLWNKKKKESTELAKILSKIWIVNENLVWNIILINLYYNSSLLYWFISNCDWNIKYTKKEDLANSLAVYGSLELSSVGKKIDSLINFFKGSNGSPFENRLKTIRLEYSDKKQKNVKTITRIPSENVDLHAIFYSIFRFTEFYNKYDLKIDNFYVQNSIGGPYRIFGITKTSLSRILLNLQDLKAVRSETEEKWLLKVELNVNLENIYLNKNNMSLENILLTNQI
jgi:phosphoadenosine phosphosulfate reductase